MTCLVINFYRDFVTVLINPETRDGLLESYHLKRVNRTLSKIRNQRRVINDTQVVYNINDFRNFVQLLRRDWSLVSHSLTVILPKTSSRTMTQLLQLFVRVKGCGIRL